MVLKDSPGVIVGMSTTKPYRDTAVFYDGDKQVLEVDLTEPMPNIDTETGMAPGVDINIFCKDSIRVDYPEGAEIEFFVS